MKKMVKKALSLTLSLILASMFVLPSVAHEMWYNNLNPISLKWNTIVSGKASLAFNADNLSSFYTPYYVATQQSWPSASNKVSSYNTLIGYSNIRLYTASTSLWDYMHGYYSVDVLGQTELYSTSNVYIGNASAAMNAPGGKIAYANVYMTPYTYVFNNNATWISYVLCHEVGHALGLGHPNVGNPYISNDASVMRQGNSNPSYSTPQTHDVNDLASKY